jgi:RHS repeat-associated protein
MLLIISSLLPVAGTMNISKNKFLEKKELYSQFSKSSIEKQNHVGNTGKEDWYFYVGGVVNAANGNVFLSTLDISIRVRAFDIKIVRSYNSHNSNQITGFGNGWTFNYNTYLVDYGAYVILVEGDGSVHNFTWAGDGNYIPESGIHLRLNKHPDGSFILWSLNGMKHFFNSAGTLLSIADKNFNCLSFNYVDGKLVKISDDSGLWLALNYNVNNRISSVIDPIGRQISYDYDANDNLVEVTDPMGNSIFYYYDSDNYLERIMTSVGKIITFTYYSARRQDGYKEAKEIWNSVVDEDLPGYLNDFKLYEFEYSDTTLNITNSRGFVSTIVMNSMGNPECIIDPLGGITMAVWDPTTYDLISFTDANGNTYYYEYDFYGNLEEAIDPTFDSTFFVWETIDNEMQYISLLRGVIDASDNMNYYDYDEFGNLICITDPTGNQSFITYYDIFCHNPSTITDALKRTTIFEYDTHGYLINIIDASGNIWEYIYDPVGRLIEAVDANGHVTNYAYDANDRIIALTDALGNMTTYSYDAIGNLISSTDANGHETSYTDNIIRRLSESTDASNNKTLFRYDREGNRILMQDERGNVETRTYDALGRLIKITDALGNTETYTYDPVGNIISETDANGHETSYTYDSLDRLIKITDAMGYNTTCEYDSLGNLISETDTRGYTTTYEYDSLCRLISVTDALGKTTSYGYDPVGNLISETNARGYTTTYEYDPLDRLIGVRDAMGNTKNYCYDLVGNKLSETDENGNMINYTYDPLDRLVKMEDALSYETHYEYDAVGNRISMTDANGHSTTYEFDPLNRLISVTDALGNKTRHEYDAVGNIIRTIDANGNIRKFEYDPLNRLIMEISPLGYSTNYVYDPVDNLITKIDANGNTITYEYDPLNRLISTSYPDGTYVNYEYDPVGNLNKVTNTGGFGDETYYEYDPLNRLVQKQVIYDMIFSKTILYTYDEVGNLVTMMDPDAHATTYTYDPLNRLITIMEPSGLATYYEYDNASRRTLLSYPNGVTTTYMYDAINRLINISTTKSGGKVISRYLYTYDNLMNRLSMTDVNGLVTSYQYDATNRLVRVDYPWGETYQYVYDGVGNRIQMLTDVTTNYAYDADDRLISMDSVVFAYDNNGNLISETRNGQTTIYEYNYENQLRVVNLPDDSIIEYSYAGISKYSIFSDRLRRTDNNGVTNYFYDFEDVLMELDGLGEQKVRYTHGANIDEPICMVSDSSMYYYHFDGLGSVISLTDSGENVVATYEYDAFGAIIAQTGTLENPYRYTSREFDNETSLYNYRTRYYNTEVGRFLSKDTEGLAEGFNLYTYAENNPVNFIDPFGKWCEGPKLKKHDHFQQIKKAIGMAMNKMFNAGNQLVFWKIFQNEMGLLAAGNGANQRPGPQHQFWLPCTGPTIEVGTDNEDDFKKCKKTTRGYYPGKDPKKNTVYISKWLLDALCSKKLCKKQKKVILNAIARTIVHETAHWVDWQDGNRRWPRPMDPGEVMEDAVFGQGKIGDTIPDSIIKKLKCENSTSPIPPDTPMPPMPPITSTPEPVPSTPVPTSNPVPSTPTPVPTPSPGKPVIIPGSANLLPIPYWFLSPITIYGGNLADGDYKIGTKDGTFGFEIWDDDHGPTTNNRLRISVDGGTPQIITLSGDGNVPIEAVVTEINSQLVGGYAVNEYVADGQFIRIASYSTSSDSNITLLFIKNSAYKALGLENYVSSSALDLLSTMNSGASYEARLIVKTSQVVCLSR